MKLVTGRGTENEITWEEEEDAVRLPPASVPIRGGETSIGDMPLLPAVLPEDFDGAFRGDWLLSQTNGLTVENIHYIQPGTPFGPLTHHVVEFLQWRNCRLILEGAGAPVPPEIPIQLTRCSAAFKLTRPGVRKSDGKKFACAVGATFLPPPVPDPRDSSILYTVQIREAFLFGAPAADQEPASALMAIKVFPTLEVSITSNKLSAFPAPSFAADLKMIFAPRLTRPDQHRQGSQFLPTARQNTNVVSLFCDTNDLTRPIPGQPDPILLIVPVAPLWNVVFDYAEPELDFETVFDAVVFPRTLTNTTPFTIEAIRALRRPLDITAPLEVFVSELKCRREPGQGEFDNVHIHPYVGFDDPAGAAASFTNRTHALVEAPIAADEVIHLHWRWGKGIPAGAKPPVSPAPFKGFSDLPKNEPNQKDGAPLIPANQSLRIKIGRGGPLSPAEDNANASTSASGIGLTRDSTAVWYAAKVHQPGDGCLSQFFGQGFGLGYLLHPLTSTILGLLPVTVTNSELLDPAPFSPKPNYHDMRWVTFSAINFQRVPTASAPNMQGLSRNNLGIGSPPVSKSSWP